MNIVSWLVVYIPLCKIWKSVGMIIPNIWKNKIHVPNHQPDIVRVEGITPHLKRSTSQENDASRGHNFLLTGWTLTKFGESIGAHFQERKRITIFIQNQWTSWFWLFVDAVEHVEHKLNTSWTRWHGSIVIQMIQSIDWFKKKYRTIPYFMRKSMVSNPLIQGTFKLFHQGIAAILQGDGRLPRLSWTRCDVWLAPGGGVLWGTPQRFLNAWNGKPWCLTWITD